MMGKRSKIVTIIVMIIMLLAVAKPINAVNIKSESQEIITIKVADKATAGDIIGDGDSFIQKGTKNASDIFSTSELQDLSSTIYNILLVVGIVIAVLLGAILGIKFMMEGTEGKAEVQKALVPYVIGCIVIFGAFAIWKIVVTVLQGI